ncbi:MAG: hypothetical protein ACF8PN_14395 [Phycisphaerales bacterium]
MVTGGDRIAVACIFCLLVVNALGCAQSPKSPTLDEYGSPPTYDDLVERQNTRVASIERFWTFVSLELKWIDEDGDARTEVGAGNFIFERPDRAALTFEKLGEVYFWAGSDEDRFWLFEGGESSVGYVGRNANAFSPCADPLPFTAHPSELLDLFGILELPTSEELDSDELVVGASDEWNAWVVTIPGRFSGRRVYFEPEEWLPIRVELIDPVDERVLVASDLANYTPLAMETLPRFAAPVVPTRMVVAAGGSQDGGYVRMTGREPADSPKARSFNPRVFSFEAVRRNMRPKRLVILDAACPDPALELGDGASSGG